MTDPWPDLAGRLDGHSHVLPIRVYFEDTDFSGLVYHGSFVRWMERGRSDWLRMLGIHHHELIAGNPPAAFVVRRLVLDYLRPARIDEQLEIRSSLKALTAATLTLAQDVTRGGEVLVKGEVLAVLVGAHGKPLRLPAKLKSAFGPA